MTSCETPERSERARIGGFPASALTLRTTVVDTAYVELKGTLTRLEHVKTPHTRAMSASSTTRHGLEPIIGERLLTAEQSGSPSGRSGGYDDTISAPTPQVRQSAR
jgi:hypothetical protein